MQAIELVRSSDKKEPAAEETKQITQYCYEHGLITITAGTYSNVVRILVPLVITEDRWTRGWTCWSPRCRWSMKKEAPLPSQFRTIQMIWAARRLACVRRYNICEMNL